MAWVFLAPDTQAFLLVPRFTLLVIGIEGAFVFSSGSVTPGAQAQPVARNRLALS